MADRPQVPAPFPAQLPVSMELHPVQASMRPGTETVEYLLVRLKAMDKVDGPRPRLSAVLVLDCSGSMGGEPIAQVIQSTQRLADILGEDDSLGVVAFADGAQTICPLRRLTAEARRAVQREAALLRAGGQTNMAGGLSHAALLFPARPTGERHLVLLLSDGQPNVGAATPQALAEQARLLRERDIAVSSLGYGPQHNDDVLVSVSDGGGGRYAFVDDPRLAGASFARALGAQRDVVAEEPALLITPAPGVEVVRVLGDPRVSVGAEGMRVSLQDLIAGDELNVVLELKVRTPREGGAWHPLKLAFSARPPGVRERFALRSEVAVAIRGAGPWPQDELALAAVAIAFADEMRAQARTLSDRREFAAAAAVLRKAKAMIEGTPGYVEGAHGQLNDAREALVDEIAAMEQHPDAEKYQAWKRATRDYADFATGGTKTRGGTSILGSSPSAIAMVEKLIGKHIPKAQLVVVTGAGAGTVHPLGVEVDIGRAQGNGIVVPSALVTRRHARVVLHEGEFWLVDLGSSNGTSLNGRPVQRAQLQHGDVIRVGDVELRFEKLAVPPGVN